MAIINIKYIASDLCLHHACMEEKAQENYHGLHIKVVTNFNFGKATLSNIEKLLMRHQEIVSLEIKLDYPGLPQQELKILVQAITHLKQLKYLNLNLAGNNLKDNTFSELSTIFNLASLEKLSLNVTANQLTDSSITNFLTALKAVNRQLPIFFLAEKNQFSDAIIDNVEAHLYACTQLQTFACNNQTTYPLLQIYLKRNILLANYPVHAATIKTLCIRAGLLAVDAKFKNNVPSLKTLVAHFLYSQTVTIDTNKLPQDILELITCIHAIKRLPQERSAMHALT